MKRLTRKVRDSKTTKGIIAILLVACFILIGNVAVQAETNYPNEPIKYVIPWNVGGRSDLMARIIAPTLGEILGQPVVVVSKPGGSGVMGAQWVARQKPDGYTFIMTSNSFLMTQYTVRTPTDLNWYEIVCQPSADPALLTVNAKRGWKTLQEFIEYAKKHPEDVKNAHGGTGNNDHIHAEAFAKKAGIKLHQIPYRGDANAVPAVAGGHADSNFAPMIAVKSLADAGILRVLAVASDERMSMFPDIPTFKEQGVDFVMGSWQGIFVPKGTPLAIVDKLDQAWKTALENEGVQKLMKNANLGIKYRPRKEFVKYIHEEDRMISEIIEELGLRLAPKK
jgi:tripartite-type tricarboxylate transporter receptor subunit TctC